MEEKILVTQSSMPDFQEYIDEIAELWDTKWLTNSGKKHQKLQEELKEYLQVDNVELLTNGHMALEVILQAMNLKGEVITTPFTFASTTHAIVNNGLTPVFCDVNPNDYTMDVNKIEELITDKTCAIMPVHVYGNICDVEKIEEIAKKHNLIVIYDSAHTFGVKYKNRGIASFGDASCFSFHATKVFNTIEGGAICTNNSDLMPIIHQIKNFGIKDQETINMSGTNAKMNEFCASMGLCNLKHIEREIDKRKSVCERYNSRLKDIAGIKINTTQKDVVSNYAYYPIIVDESVFGKTRDDIYEYLLKHNINARKYFYPITNQFDCYKDKYNTNTPVALKLSKQVLTLPLYADLRFDIVDKICDFIIECSHN